MRFLNSANIRVSYTQTNTLRFQLVHLKDKISKTNTSNIIQCKDCPIEYIVQTARELEVRVAEHLRKMIRFPRNKFEYDTLVKDSTITGHTLDDNVD